MIKAFSKLTQWLLAQESIYQFGLMVEREKSGKLDVLTVKALILYLSRLTIHRVTPAY